jgi:hypothetical protein
VAVLFAKRANRGALPAPTGTWPDRGPTRFPRRRTGAGQTGPIQRTVVIADGYFRHPICKCVLDRGNAQHDVADKIP